MYYIYWYLLAEVDVLASYNNNQLLFLLLWQKTVRDSPISKNSVTTDVVVRS